MKNIGALVLIALAVVGSSLQAVGIKETAMLTVSGAARRPIEIVEPAVLGLSNVFRGAFIAAPAPEPDASWTRYTITFDVQTLEGVKAAAYAVRYCSSPLTGEGFVYLPGRGEDFYRGNIGTIIRDGQDGRWHRASPEWSAAINQRLR